jgi:hypothetical protein
MTAKELVNLLIKLDPNTRIFVRGYEGGYDDAEYFGVEDYVLDVSAGIFNGIHGRITSDEDLLCEDFKGKTVVKGVCL